jgi:hypothetical protein
MGFRTTQIIAVTARLGLADLLASIASAWSASTSGERQSSTLLMTWV